MKRWLPIVFVLIGFLVPPGDACTVVPNLMDPPSNLGRIAYSTSPHEITLSWQDNSSIEDGFLVEKSYDGGLTWDDAGMTTGANITSVVIPLGVSTGFPYFRVQGLVGGAGSSYSNVISIEGTDPTVADTDGDGMVDGFEVTNALDPYVNDAFQDLDGDRYPNIFEYKKGSDVADSLSLPAIDFVVDPSVPASGNVYNTIAAAFAAVADDHQIVTVKDGQYAGSSNVNLSFPTSHPILLISENGAAYTDLDAEESSRVFTIATNSVIDGFTFRNGVAATGGSILVQGGAPAWINCVFLDNAATTSGGAIYQNDGDSLILHSTFSCNSAPAGSAIGVLAGSVTIDKSILWNRGASEIDPASGVSVHVNDSIVTFGHSGVGNINSDPLLTRSGHLSLGSPAINQGDILFTSLVDMDGEARPVGSSTDLGADEYIDSDSDGLPDWWESLHFGEAESVTSSSGNADGDGLTNLQEYQQGSDPTNYYSQGSTTIVPTLAILSGNNQYAQTGSTTIAPLVVKVTDASNTPLHNAPVTFTVTTGGGVLASTVGGTILGASYSTTTASDGTATIYLKPGGVAATVNQLSATTSTFNVNFSATTVGGERAVDGRQVSSRGQFYSVALRNDGTVWSWGQNNFGQLGNNTTVDSAVPVQVSGLSGIVSIATGDNFSAALKNDGTVWTWGYNNYGQIGDNTTTNRLIPISVPGLSGVVAIACGGAHILALKSDGTLMAWGQNLKGQVGNNTIVSSKVPVAVSGLTNVVGMAAGGNHSAAVTADGTVWTWGYNLSGQLGDNTVVDSIVPKQISSGSLDGVVAVSAGYAHTVALKSDGTVKGWGNNNNGQLGTGSMGASRIPVAFGSLAGVTSISAGYSQTFALKGDGTAWGAGINAVGQLGDGTTTRRLSPVNLTTLEGVESLAGGTNHAMAVKSDGSVLGWGSNTRGQLGQGVLSEPNVPLPVPGLKGITSVSTGSLFGSALKNNKTVVTWGSNDRGQLGNGTTLPSFVPSLVPGLSNVAAIANGGSYALALKADETVWSWGENTNGQLGDNTTTDRTTPVQVSGLTDVAALAASTGASLALKSDGTVWAWGSNSAGQLGINSSTVVNSKVPVQVVGASGGFLTGIASICGAGNHFAALASNGTLYSWGENANGQVGNNTTTNSILPVQVATDVVSISAGANFMIAKKADGTVLTWGQNTNGQLGNNTTTNSLVPIAISALSGVAAVQAGASHALAVRDDGTVLAWGLNSSGQLGDGTVDQRNVPTVINSMEGVVQVVGGSNFSLALKQDGTVYAFGSDDGGQLGVNIGPFKLTPLAVLGLNLTTVTLPTIALNAPSNPTPMAGDVVTFSTTVSGDTAKVEFFQEGVKIGQDSSAPFQLTLTTSTWGDPHITAIASNVDGLSSERSAVYELAIGHDADGDNDGLNDRWEAANGFDPNNPDENNNGIADGADDSDGDGLTNLQEYEQGSDAHDYYSQGSVTITPTVTIVSGNSQSGVVGVPLANPLVVKVTNGATNLQNAPVTFTVTQGGGNVSINSDGTPALVNPLTVTTASTGEAGVFLLQPALSGGGTVTATSGNQTVTFTANFIPRVDAVTTGAAFSPIADVRVVKFKTATTGATIKYTIDGTDPAVSGLTATSDQLIRIPRGSTVRAIATKVGYGTSQEYTATFGRAQVKAGSDFSAAISQSGIIYTWGTSNNYGQLASGNRLPGYFPFPVASQAVGGISISTGSNHVVFSKDDGTTWAAGYNGYGQIGNAASGTDILSEAQVAGSYDFLEVAGGQNHTVALADDETVYSWGRNDVGQIGNGMTGSGLTSPTAITIAGGATSVSAGLSHSMALKKTVGQVAVWGVNDKGQLGLGNSSNVSSPSDAKISASVNLTDVVLISGGARSSVALKKDGTVWTTGDNNAGQLGLGDTTMRNYFTQVSGLTGVVKVSAGYEHTLALKDDGSVYGWGNNGQKQINSSVTVSYTTPTAISGVTNAIDISAGTNHSIILLADGSVILIGKDSRPNPIVLATQAPQPVLSHVSGNYNGPISVQVTCSDPIAAIHYTQDGTDPTESSPLVNSGSYVAISSSGILKTKAFNSTVQPSTTAVALYTIGGRIYSDPGQNPYDACGVVTAEGRVLVFGVNQLGKLGLGSSVSTVSLPTIVPGLSDVREVAIGDYHSIFLLNDGTVRAVGANYSGALGAGLADGAISYTPVQVTGLTDVVSIATSGRHSIALKSDGTVWAWGYNGYGQLGDNTTTSSTTPVQVQGITDAVFIAQGGENLSLALKADGTVWYWGSGYFDSVSSVRVATQSKSIRDVSYISGNNFHTLAVRKDGTAWSIGRNLYWLLGSSSVPYDGIPRYFVPVDNLANIISVGTGGNQSFAVDNEGRLWAWGYMMWGALGVGVYGPGSLSDDNGFNGQMQSAPIRSQLPSKAIVASGGFFHAVATGWHGGPFWTWGKGNQSAIGDGSTANRYVPAQLRFNYADSDGDGFSDWQEILLGTDPNKADTNNNGIDDRTEYYSGRDPLVLDCDGDGVSNEDEVAAGTDPFSTDSDNDGVDDALDAFPLDPTRSEQPEEDVFDTTPPTFILSKPQDAVLIDP